MQNESCSVLGTHEYVCFCNLHFSDTELLGNEKLSTERSPYLRQQKPYPAGDVAISRRPSINVQFLHELPNYVTPACATLVVIGLNHGNGHVTWPTRRTIRVYSYRTKYTQPSLIRGTSVTEGAGDSESTATQNLAYRYPCTHTYKLMCHYILGVFLC